MSSCTVAALAADASLRLRVLVDAGNHERLLRGVHVSDLDHPAQYAFPGELLLTNGLWLTTTEPRDWVTEARAAGVGDAFRHLGAIAAARYQSRETSAALRVPTDDHNPAAHGRPRAP